jgi:hypothetical protein
MAATSSSVAEGPSATELATGDEVIILDILLEGDIRAEDQLEDWVDIRVVFLYPCLYLLLDPRKAQPGTCLKQTPLGAQARYLSHRRVKSRLRD